MALRRLLSARYSRSQEKDRSPETVDLTAFEDLDWFQASERLALRFEPSRDDVLRHHVHECAPQSPHLLQSSSTGLADLPAAFPTSDRSFRKAGHPGKHFKRHPQLPAHLESAVGRLPGRNRGARRCQPPRLESPPALSLVYLLLRFSSIHRRILFKHSAQPPVSGPRPRFVVPGGEETKPSAD